VISARLSQARHVCVAILASIGASFLLIVYSPLANVLAMPLNRVPSCPTEADVMVVLSGGHDRDGSLNDAALERTIAAVRLYRRGLAPRILFTGGPCCGRSTSVFMAQLAMAVGVPSSAILLDEQSLRTRDNAIHSAALLRGRGIRTALLVTGPLHLPRAKLAFEALGISVYPVRASERDLMRRSSAVERLSLVQDSVHEYIGLAFYRMRGWI
jgi:uncharacterized SAM-binding protein YcdF (DUF218 family)